MSATTPKPPIQLHAADSQPGGIKTINEDVGAMIAARDSGAYRVDQEALAEAVATLMADKSGSKNKASMVTIIGSVLALIGTAGAGNWAVMSNGDAETQTIVRQELQTYGDKMETKVRAEREVLKNVMAKDRESVHDEIGEIKTSMQKMQVDIAVLRAKAGK